MAEHRWGEDSPSDVSEARQRLLDSAEACVSRFGLNKTTVDDIAAHAKVSRATVYRYFDGRDAIVLGVLERELDRFGDEMASELVRHSDLANFIVESILWTIDAVRSSEHLALLFAPHAAGITAEIAGASESLFMKNLDFLRPYFERAQESGDLRADVDPEDLAEWTLRITLSLLTVKGPASRSTDETRDFLLMLLGPVLASSKPA